MYFIQFKKPKLFYLFVAFIITFGFINLLVKAEEDYLTLPEKSFEVVNNNDRNSYSDSSSEAFDSEGYRSTDGFENSKINVKRKYKKLNPLIMSDSAFTGGQSVTFKDLVIRVALIVLFLLGVFFFVKMFMSRNRFDQAGSFFDNLAQKFSNKFSTSGEIKLIQTLMLTPGQNIYVVEVEGKRLLIGGTQQGGIQFLADLTESNVTSALDFRQIENLQTQNHTKHVPFNLMHESPEPTKSLSPKEIETPFVAQKVNDSNSSGQAFKRRVNFRQSLLSRSITEPGTISAKTF